MVTVSCLFCKKNYDTYPYLLGKTKFCSNRCKILAHPEISRKGGIAIARKRKTLPEYIKRKIRATHRAKIDYSKKRPLPPSRLKERMFMNSFLYKKWKKGVFEKFGGFCAWCKSEEGLHCHHIKSRKKFPHLSLFVSNSLLLCSSCHKMTDSYGKRS